MLSFQRSRITNNGDVGYYDQCKNGCDLITSSHFLLGIAFEYDIPFAHVIPLSLCTHCQYLISYKCTQQNIRFGVIGFCFDYSNSGE